MQAEPPQITSSKSTTGKGKRPPLRYWAVQDKRRIVEETFVPGASVSVVARKNDMNSNMLFRWRREYHRGEFGPAASQLKTSPGFVPIGVIGDDGRLVQDVADIRQELQASVPEQPALTSAKQIPAASEVPAAAGRVEIELPSRVRFSFDATLEDAALRRLITLIKELT
jgi:transposase-like protein